MGGLGYTLQGTHLDLLCLMLLLPTMDTSGGGFWDIEARSRLWWFGDKDTINCILQILNIIHTCARVR